MGEWIKTAKVGDKVQCVNAAEDPGYVWSDGEALIEGRIYTIDAVWIDACAGIAVAEFKELKRAARSHICHGRHVGYGLSRFRPVPRRATDISIFTKLLNADPVEVLEEA